MKKSMIAVLVIVFMICLVPSSFAEGDNNAMKKLGRGLCNIFTFAFEIPVNMAAVSEKDGWPAGMTYGVIKGLAASVVRLGVGVYETVSFPIPAPKGYEPILTNPEFFFSDQP